MIKCKCGCGTLIEPRDSRNRPRQYVWGHHNMAILKKHAKKKGEIPWNRGIKTGHTPWNKGKEWPEMTGENNPAWRGGVTRTRGDRWSKEYRRWRNAVLRRDNHICIWCGATRETAVIQVDHIKSWSKYPELRFEISNGRTLCWDCHKTTDTYGYRKKTS